ncbi:MaoC/PaaZ C-terminal domain-containing protein [Kineococcus glutinatus]|uniref:MaoC/PaaZ C-terminal domain-containing protein n=1 Tax=Kineococcus glutinatus TaxID=1070872 RepID=A0ABP9H7B2_9ACTN
MDHRAEPRVRVLRGTPSLGPLYARALLARPDPAADPTGVELEQHGVRAGAAHAAAYARVCGFGLRDELPATYPHLLAFGAQVALMVTEPFPFRLAGLVHVRQRVEQHRPLRVGEELDVRVAASPVRSARSGAVVDLLAQVRAAGTQEVLWRGTSTYLARVERARAGAVADDVPALEPPVPGEGGAGQPALWRVAPDTGRRYAAVSGDVNPIHVSALGARALGFAGPIAHGMWTAARSLAALEGRLPGALALDVRFARPLPLGAAVEDVALREGGDWRTAVRGGSGQSRRLHLVAAVGPA